MKQLIYLILIFELLIACENKSESTVKLPPPPPIPKDYIIKVGDKTFEMSKEEYEKFCDSLNINIDSLHNKGIM